MIKKRSIARGAYVSSDPIDRLSNRELQILRLIGKGMSTRETAEFAHPEHQDGRIAPPADQDQAQFAYRHATRAVRDQLVYRPRNRHAQIPDRRGAANADA